MKTFYTMLLACFIAGALQAQARYSVPDTLLQEHFEGTMDPADDMLPAPTGYDDVWVNYDQDAYIAECVEGAPTPKAWYLEGELSNAPLGVFENSCFTSCSWVKYPGKNSNWLITSRVYVPDEQCTLSWRSMPFSGPAYMDGYMVLVSRTTNLPLAAAFKDTLFRAAETVDIFVSDTAIALNKYTFSPGYMHANAFTDTAYCYLYQLTEEPPSFVYRARLEPHIVSLADYVGDSIYIAFWHNSADDFLLQIDDIVVSSDNTSASFDPSDLVQGFTINPNPVAQDTYISWKLNGGPTETLLRICSVDGREVFSRRFAAESIPQYFADLSALSAGTYICSLQLPQGIVSKVLIKQ